MQQRAFGDTMNAQQSTVHHRIESIERQCSEPPLCVPRACSAWLAVAAIAAGAGCAGGEKAATAPAPQPTTAVAAGGPSKRATQPKPGVPWENSLGMKFVPVPGTNVLFSIWETRVQDFEAFVKATGHDAGDAWRAPGDTGEAHTVGFSQTPLHPVVFVNWRDVEAFCRWLTAKEQAAGNLAAGQEYRLPTDAEWSLAVGLPAEPGATPEDKDSEVRNVYPWGGAYPPPTGSGNYSGAWDGWSGKIDGYADGAKFTAKVGSYAPNQLGIYDLGGNVWEWCGDWFNTEQKDRVARGASFNQGTSGRLVSSYRPPVPPGRRDYNFGFRCVVTVGPNSP